MANVKINQSFQYFLIIGMVAVMVLSLFAAFKPVNVSVDINEDEIAQKVAGAIILPSNNSTEVQDKLDAIYNEMFKKDTAEDIAENLALDELETKDFKKVLITFLMDKETTLENMDYKDIEDINVRDIDTKFYSRRKEATVEVEFKVYVSNYGDVDEEEKARVKVIFNVVDLDEDEDYEDAEVFSYSDFELIKFYD